MSRYYDITLTPTPLSSGNQPQTWTSFPNRTYDPGALNVQLDLLASPMATPMGNSTISIDGISLQDLLQAQQFANMNIVVKGGMQAGLPLANPSQAGVLLQGMVYQSFANWVGTDMNLNFVVIPSIYTFAKPGGLVIQWNKGQALSDAIAIMLQAAYPANPRIINIGANYSTSATLTHAVQTLPQFASWLKSITKSSSSPGVDITILPSGAIYAWDGTSKGAAVSLAFTDLIGQPKWVDQNVMQFVTIMRADIQVGSLVTMPVGLQNLPGIVQTQASSLPSQLKYKTSFQGQFIVQSIRHVGNFRDSDGASWATYFQAAPLS